jgi:tRNA modification GTPase
MDTALGAMAGEASDLPRVVLTGPPNAGKSTLFNVLCGEDRVVVSPTAGTTRDAIEAVVTLTRELRGEEVRCVLVDTAGVGDATADVLESDAVATATRAVHSADVVVRCRSADDERGPVARADGAAAVIDVVTKGDLGQGRTVHISPDEDHAALRISSITGDGLPALKMHIADAVGEVTGSDVRRSLLERLRRGLRQARTCLDEAMDLIHTADASAAVPGPELVAATIHAALEELALLDGTLDPDRVLDEVFGRFCVGK